DHRPYGLVGSYSPRLCADGGEIRIEVAERRTLTLGQRIRGGDEPARMLEVVGAPEGHRRLHRAVLEVPVREAAVGDRATHDLLIPIKGRPDVLELAPIGEHREEVR